MLAPLDFDMAFTKNTFNKLKDGKRDDALFRDYMEMEKNGMLTALAGDEQLNSGVKGTADLPHNFLPLKWALR